jgi:Icc-related predicted phosphoesterase
MNRVHELNILYHIFGHIHEDAGKTLKLHNLDTIFINASVVNLAYKIINSKGLTITLNK